MSHLAIYADDAPAAPLVETADREAIAAELAAIGVRFEHWGTRPIAADAGQDDVLAAYAAEIDRLKAHGGYQAVDVIRMVPDHPHLAALRAKFLDEHTHAEDEVRVFVEGEGLFTLHAKARVFNVLCGVGDLISVPAGTPHWFDMGPRPRFTAIRLFTNPEGWVAHYTGSGIAARFPRHEPVAA
jgi:1,2-dihydroxy-3-keto-5-methylthiopentene dioxygenase